MCRVQGHSSWRQSHGSVILLGRLQAVMTQESIIKMEICHSNKHKDRKKCAHICWFSQSSFTHKENASVSIITKCFFFCLFYLITILRDIVCALGGMMWGWMCGLFNIGPIASWLHYYNHHYTLCNQERDQRNYSVCNQDHNSLLQWIFLLSSALVCAREKWDIGANVTCVYTR